MWTKNFLKHLKKLGKKPKKPGLTPYYVKVPPLFALPTHTHDIEIQVYVMEGETSFDTPDGRFNATQGDRIVIPPFAIHSEGKIGPDGVTYIVAFRGNVSMARGFRLHFASGILSGNRMLPFFDPPLFSIICFFGNFLDSVGIWPWSWF